MKLPGISSSTSSIPEFSLSFRGAVLILVLTGIYIVMIIQFPLRLRLAAIAVLAVSVLLFWKPSPSFWLPAIPFVIIMGGRVVGAGIFNPTILTLAAFSYYIFYTFNKIVSNRPFPSMHLSVKLVLLAALIQVVSIVVSIHVRGQFFWNAVREGSSVFLFMPFVFIIPDLFRTDDKLRIFARSIILSILIAGVIGVFEYFSISGFSKLDISLGYVYRGRVSSLLSNPNVFSGYLELGVPLSIAIGMWEKSRKWKIISYSAALTGVLSVLYTFSRGGLLSVTVGSIIVLTYHFRKRLWIPILMMMLFIGMLIRYGSVFERQMSFFANPADLAYQPTLLHRYVTYRSVFREFRESPVTGVGWGAKPFFWGRTGLYSFWEIRHAASTEHMAHFGGLNNLILTFAVRGGLIGLGVLLLIILSAVLVISNTYRNIPRPWGIGIAAGFIAFFLHQTMDNFLQWEQTNCLFWLLMGIAVAAVQISKTGKQKLRASTDSFSLNQKSV